jgi:DNA-binding transcriptional MocR family regulator
MAHSVGLRIAPGPRFAADGGFERFVRLPFTLAEADMTRAVERLAQAEARLLSGAFRGAESPLGLIEAERVI